MHMNEQRSGVLRTLLDNLEKEMIKSGTSQADMDVLKVGASHPYECKCDICKRYWELLGPER